MHRLAGPMPASVLALAFASACGPGSGSAPPQEPPPPEPVAPVVEEKAETEVEAGPDEPVVDPSKKALDDDLLASVAEEDWIAAAGALSKGADGSAAVGKEGLEEIHVAALAGDMEAVAKLVEGGADVTSETRTAMTPLHLACASGARKVVDFLMEKGADVEARSIGGYTALHFAALGGYLDLVQHLVEEKKAGVKVPKGEEGCSPVFGAVESGSLAVVEYLLKKGGSAKDLCQAGSTPLHVAASKNLLDVATFLVGKGAKANVRNEDGETPLHAVARDCAAEQSCAEMVKLLLKKGADKYLLDSEDKMPYDYAADSGNAELMELLEP